MIKGKTILAVIPARGGSKGLPRKNLRMLAGKPLIAWTIEEAKKSKYIDRLILSSEDKEIIEVARDWKCEVPFIRPLELAADETPGVEPILHAIDALSEKFDYVVMLQPTSPLRLTEDIDGCIEMCHAKQSPACVSVTEPAESPYLSYQVDIQDTHVTTPITNIGYTTARRQDLPRAYVLNGAVYVFDTGWIKRNQTNFMTSETIAYIMPLDRSKDVNTELDLKFCELLIQERSDK